MTACGGGTIGYMWVLGTYYNQISGFLIDDYTGNLTAANHSPYSSGGTNPVMMLVKPGGRFVFVINSGSGATGTPGTAAFTSPGEAISVFSVGGGAQLTFQQNYFSQGTQPVWASFDSSGNYLYVVDKYSPDYTTTGNGSITAFSIAGDTGRLTLVPNTSILVNQVPQTWFDVGPNPTMAKIGSGSCLFTISKNTIFPYSVNSSNGQLSTVTTGAYLVGNPGTLTSINTGGSSFIYLTDGPGNLIFSLQAGGSACSLQPISGSQQTNLSGSINPVNSITSSNGKFLYVLNYSNTNNPVGTANSTISAFTINSQGQIGQLSDSTNNPYAVGSGPTCIVQDPSSQYLYISDYNDSTVTGKLLNQNTGYLSDLGRGTVFPTSMKPSCLAVSGNL
jgi:6-phosphogluconolactonase (cycloisomerase 2 family)